jgi:16S rRNA (guanine527-N7)-methyltransferase
MTNDMTGRTQESDIEEFRASLEAAIASFGLDPLSEEQAARLVKHYSMLAQWNRRINLTRIIAPKEAARFHYAESLYGSRFIAGARSILDVGSGAGFPAVPLAVILTGCRITALEANQKKALFLSEVKDALSLDNLSVSRQRFEEFDSSGFDLITSRALDRAEHIWSASIDRLEKRQRLLLYAAPDLVTRLRESLPPGFFVETNPIPLAENRIIALIGQNN